MLALVCLILFRNEILQGGGVCSGFGVVFFGGCLFLFCFFLLVRSHLESVSGTIVLSLNEEHMQGSLPMWNFNELSGSNVMRFCQMWTEIAYRILKEALRPTAFSASIWKQPGVCDLWRLMWNCDPEETPTCNRGPEERPWFSQASLMNNMCLFKSEHFKIIWFCFFFLIHYIKNRKNN